MGSSSVFQNHANAISQTIKILPVGLNLSGVHKSRPHRCLCLLSSLLHEHFPSLPLLFSLQFSLFSKSYGVLSFSQQIVGPLLYFSRLTGLPSFLHDLEVHFFFSSTVFLSAFTETASSFLSTKPSLREPNSFHWDLLSSPKIVCFGFFSFFFAAYYSRERKIVRTK